MKTMLEQRVGEIAAEMPGSAKVFKDHHIDFCCGGKRRLQDACRVAGADPDEVAAKILAASKSPSALMRAWNDEPLEDLIRYILEVHHTYMRSELPSLSRIIANLDDFQGVRQQAVLPIRRALARLTDEIQAHMRKEETVLFPAIIRLEGAVIAKAALPKFAFGSVHNPIRMMEQEHDAIGSIFGEIRTHSGVCTLRDPQYEMFRVCGALSSLETDQQEHIHLENNVLFPRAMQLEAQLIGSPKAHGMANGAT